MNRGKEEYVALPPSSGNARVDKFFFKIIDILRARRVRVYKVKIIRDYENPKNELYGFLCTNHKEAFVTHDPPDGPIRLNVIHEMLHAAYPYTCEKTILKREDLLWNNITRDQRRYLGMFIPKHFVKRDPIVAEKSNLARSKPQKKS